MQRALRRARAAASTVRSSSAPLIPACQRHSRGGSQPLAQTGLAVGRRNLDQMVWSVPGAAAHVVAPIAAAASAHTDLLVAAPRTDLHAGEETAA